MTQRRPILRLGAALAGLVVAGRATAVARADDGDTLVGSWTVGVTPAGGSPAPPRILATFADDGTALRTAPLQQVAPPSLGAEKMFISTTHGAWMRESDGTFGLTFVGFAFDETGKFLATQRVRVVVEVTGETFSGPFKTDFISGDGQVLASGSGTVQGTRVQVEALA